MYTRNRNANNQSYGGPGTRGRQSLSLSANSPAQNTALNQQPATPFKASPLMPNANVQTPVGKQQQSQPQKVQAQVANQQQPMAVDPVQTVDAQKIKPILKQVTSTPNNPQQAPAITNVTPVRSTSPKSIISDGTDNQDMESVDQPKWKKNKVPGTKINRKLKRLRMDQRLRKTLMPKNAIMVLNEIRAGVEYVFPESTSVQNSLFLVHANLDGKTYVGQGLSKLSARQNAAENAFKSLILEKMSTASKLREESEMEMKKSQENINKPQEQQVTPQLTEKPAEDNNDMKMQVDNTENDVNMMDVLNETAPDNVPWRALANFALYKLLNEWQNQGTVVIMPRPGNMPMAKPKPEPKQAVSKDLPPNALSIHPVMLLNQMRPGSTYVEISRNGTPPNTMFTLGVEIDGTKYEGTAKNKKEAKKAAALKALKTVFGLEYPEEMKTDNSSEASGNSQVLDGFVLPGMIQ